MLRTYENVNTYMYIVSIQICVYVYICVYICMYVCTHACLYACIHMYIYTYLHICISVFVRKYHMNKGYTPKPPFKGRWSSAPKVSYRLISVASYNRQGQPSSGGLKAASATKNISGKAQWTSIFHDPKGPNTNIIRTLGPSNGYSRLWTLWVRVRALLKDFVAPVGVDIYIRQA